jgi:mRNA-degrading endonuclease YafQ of YafQ-DinJ toxin-antitoxin module
LVFKENPYDPKLGTHRINSLSAQYKKTIQSVVVEGDLRIVFFAEGNLIKTVDIGTHSIYR